MKVNHNDLKLSTFTLLVYLLIYRNKFFVAQFFFQQFLCKIILWRHKIFRLIFLNKKSKFFCIFSLGETSRHGFIMTCVFIGLPIRFMHEIKLSNNICIYFQFIPHENEFITSSPFLMISWIWIVKILCISNLNAKKILWFFNEKNWVVKFEKLPKKS